MRKESTIIFTREDLVKESENKMLNQIGLNDLKCSVDVLHKESIILFIDFDGTTRILKNRFGSKVNSKVLFV